MISAKTQAEIRMLMDVALGRTPADLAIVNADLVNVYSGEILEKQSVAVKGPWIAYVGPDIGAMIGPETDLIEADGRTLIPGLIDSHTHIAWLYSAPEFVRLAAPGGTTLVVTEALEPYAVSGCAGVIDFLDSLQNQPIKMLATAPAMVSISASARRISDADLERLLDRSDILGLGESYWQEVLKFPDVYLEVMAKTQQKGKRLEGHTAGAKDAKLNAYIAAGVSSCHEPIDADQVLAGVRLGLHIMIREGSIRRDLEGIARIKDSGIDLRRLILVTDGLSAEDLLSEGHMGNLVQKAIECGFEPISAIQMATLNPAEHFGLDNVLGGIGPGKYADMVLIPNERTIEAEAVVSNGRVIAEKGRLKAPVRSHRFQGASLASVNLPSPLTAEDFSISVPRQSETVKVRVIEMVTDLVTKETHVELPAASGCLGADPGNDMVKIAALDRTRNPGKRFIGLIKGFGLESGAMACSAAWDASDIVVAGCSDSDMAAAVNRIRDLNGGAVITSNGRVLAEIPLPVFGIVSTEPIETIARQSRQFSAAAADLGVRFPDPLLSLITLTGAAIPYLRLCEEGLVNLKDGRTMGLIVED